MTIDEAINNLKRGKCIPYKHETLTLVIESLEAWGKVRRLRMADKMNVYLITRPKDNISWCEDDGMVVVASDKLHAEKVARCNSDDFAHSKNVKVDQVNLSKEQVVLVSNTGA